MAAQKDRGVGKPPLIITPKDIEILRFLADVGVARAKDVAYALGSRGSLTTIRRRLSELSGRANYQPRCPLYMFPLPSVNGNPERAYCVGQKGLALLASELGWSREGRFEPFKMRVVSDRFMRHTLAVASCVALARARSRPDLRLRECLLSDELGRRSPTLPAIADVWMRWEKPEAGRTLGLWIEADCATEGQATWKKLFTGKVDYLRSAAFRETFRVPRVLLCYVVVAQTAQAGERRRQSLGRYAMEVLKTHDLEKLAGNIRLTSVTLSSVYEHGLFDRLVWHTPHQPTTAVALLSP
jgi:hypothetical protein